MGQQLALPGSEDGMLSWSVLVLDVFGGLGCCLFFFLCGVVWPMTMIDGQDEPARDLSWASVADLGPLGRSPSQAWMI